MNIQPNRLTSPSTNEYRINNTERRMTKITMDVVAELLNKVPEDMLNRPAAEKDLMKAIFVEQARELVCKQEKEEATAGFGLYYKQRLASEEYNNGRMLSQLTGLAKKSESKAVSKAELNEIQGKMENILTLAKHLPNDKISVLKAQLFGR